MNVNNRGDSQFPRRRNLCPRQESVRRIERQAPTLIWLNYCDRIVAEELVEIVQVAIGF
jgi:hypothetical protein